MTKKFLILSFIFSLFFFSSCRKCYSCFDTSTDEFVEDRCGRESKEDYQTQIFDETGVATYCVPKAGGR